MDGYLAMEDEDYALLEWVLSRTKPEIISLEYSGRKSEEEETVMENIRKFFLYFKNY